MRRALLSFLVCGLVSPLAAQSVPTTVNYQGRLTDNSPSQTPVSATVDMKFELWDDAVAGTSLWSETPPGGVLVINGIFNVALGATTPLAPSLFTGLTSDRWLQITLNPGAGNEEILGPRQRIGATAYAAHAQRAVAADDTLALRGVQVSATMPFTAQVLAYNSGTGEWAPTTPANGTVTSITAGTGLTGGTITTSGTIGLSLPVASASALAANGANCAAGSVPAGVDAAGAAEGCTAVNTLAWSLAGNPLASATPVLGSTTNFPVRFVSNNIERMRINPTDGEIIAGATASPYAGDLLVGAGTVTTPFAVSGYSAQNGAGVWGEILTGGTTNFSAVQGVYSGSGNGFGVLGNYNGTSTSVTRAGVYGVVSTAAANAGGAGVYGYNNIATGSQRMGVLGQYNGAAFGLGVVGVAFGGALPPGNLDIGVVGWRGNNANYSGYFNGNHVIANGTKSASVATSKGNQLLYVTETPEVWFEDIGGGQLVNGEASIALDALFLETVVIDKKHPLRVFIQMEGDSEDVYVIPGETGFTVKERRAGRSNAPFSYRVMAKRVHFQDHRFGNDPVWGPGDTRPYAQYATPPAIDYRENLALQQRQRDNNRPAPLPPGFIGWEQLQREMQPAAAREPADAR